MKMRNQRGNLLSARDTYETGNRGAALAILENPARYAGALNGWARAFLQNHPPVEEALHVPPSVAKKPHYAQSKLFPKAAA